MIANPSLLKIQLSFIFVSYYVCENQLILAESWFKTLKLSDARRDIARSKNTVGLFFNIEPVVEYEQGRGFTGGKTLLKVLSPHNQGHFEDCLAHSVLRGPGLNIFSRYIYTSGKSCFFPICLLWERINRKMMISYEYSRYIFSI